MIFSKNPYGPLTVNQNIPNNVFAFKNHNNTGFHCTNEIENDKIFKKKMKHSKTCLFDES